MKRLRPVISMLLIVLVLLSSTSFMVGVHHCGGHIADVALFTKAEPCPMEQKLPPCHKPLKPCCDDQTIVHEGQELKPSATQVHVAPAPLIAELASPVVLAMIIPLDAASRHFPLVNFSPHLPPTDIHVAIGRFQI